MSADGQNFPQGFDGLKEAAADYEARCKRLAASPLDDVTATLAQALNSEGIKLNKEITEARRTEKIPHETAAKDVDKKFKPVADIALQAQTLIKAALDKHLREQVAKREQERREAEEAARRAKEALKAADDPFAALEAEEAAQAAEQKASSAGERIQIANADGGRAISLKTYWRATVLDPQKMVAHYSSRPSVIAAARAIADAEMKDSKGEAVIPGCEPFKEMKL